jgi:hypothetical protein
MVSDVEVPINLKDFFMLVLAGTSKHKAALMLEDANTKQLLWMAFIFSSQYKLDISLFIQCCLS